MGPAALMAMQQAQQQQQMRESTMQSMANSKREHEMNMLSRQHESERAMSNDQAKRANEAQADSAALLKDTTQKLDQAAGA